MGIVFRAEHVLMKRPVAVKILHRDIRDNPQLVARFEQEAQAVARIAHPNVCIAMDFGVTEDESFYLVMEYLEGHSLGRVIDDEGPLPWRRAAEIAIQICEGLSASHASAVIHRDLKPENLMLVPREHGEGGEVVKILDFGIATTTDPRDNASKITRVGETLGTPAYMSPEQASGLESDERTDLYSLGCILFEMVSGRVPFDNPDPRGTLVMQISQPPPKIKDIHPEAMVPRPMERVIMKLLAKEPKDRYVSATAARMALEHALDKGESQSRPGLWMALGGLLLAAGAAAAIMLSGGDDVVAEPAPPVADTLRPKPAPKPRPTPTPTPSPSPTPGADATPAPVADSGATPEPEFDDNAPPVVPDDQGLKFLQHVVGTAIDDRQPVGVGEDFPENTEKIYCYIEVDNAEGPRREVTVIWYQRGVELRRYALPIGKSPAWRTWARMSLGPGRQGGWRCDVTNEQGTVISRARFVVSEPVIRPEPEPDAGGAASQAEP